MVLVLVYAVLTLAYSVSLAGFAGHQVRSASCGSRSRLQRTDDYSQGCDTAACAVNQRCTSGLPRGSRAKRAGIQRLAHTALRIPQVRIRSTSLFSKLRNAKSWTRCRQASALSFPFSAPSFLSWYTFAQAAFREIFWGKSLGDGRQVPRYKVHARTLVRRRNRQALRRLVNRRYRFVDLLLTFQSSFLQTRMITIVPSYLASSTSPIRLVIYV